MNEEQRNQILRGNAVRWLVAIPLPLISMIVLDVFELQSAARVGLYGSLVLIVPFWIAHNYLRRELSRLVRENQDSP